MRAKLNHYYARTGAAVTLGVLTLFHADAAHAASGTGIGKIFEEIKKNVGDAAGLISTLAYVAGAALGLGGIMKLKAHVDSPQQVPMKDGLMRLGAAGGLVALPFVVDSMSKTLGAQSAGTVYTPVFTAP